MPPSPSRSRDSAAGPRLPPASASRPAARSRWCEQRGGGGLAVRPGDADEARLRPGGARRAEQPLHVAQHGRARRARPLRGRVRAGQAVRDAGRKEQRVPAEASGGAGGIGERQALGLRRGARLGVVVPARTSAPQSSRRSAAGSPARPRPTTSTRSPAKGAKGREASGGAVSGSSASRARPAPAPSR